MNGKDWYRVEVKDNRGRVIIDWTASLFCTLNVKTEGGKTIIAKKSLFGAQTYITSMNESVKTRGWLSYQLNRRRSGG